MTKKDRIKNKFGGLCAYTGKPLDEKWQIDHMQSKSTFEQILVKESHYKHKLTGEICTPFEYSLSSMISLWKYIPPLYKPHPDCNKESNLVPCLSIINHYKRDLDLEGFRRYMLTFHERLNKLPKKTQVERTKNRILYMQRVAEAFGITKDKPFSGIFYFETLSI